MFSLESPGEVACSIPALLGHTPQRSVVIVLLDSNLLLKAVMRADLGQACADEALAAVANHAAADGATGAVVVVVDDSASPQTVLHRGLLERFGVAFAQREIAVLSSFVVDHIDDSGQWWCGDGCGAGGAIGDPTVCALVVDAVARGRRIYDSREELLTAVAADESRAEGFSSAVEDIDPVDPDVAVRAALEAAERIGCGVVVSDAELTRIAASLSDVRVRDGLLCSMAKRDCPGAIELWGELAKIATGKWRAEALALVGCGAFFRADGPVALAALNAALEVVPDHTLSRQLLAMLELGFHPGEVRDAIARVGWESESV